MNNSPSFLTPLKKSISLGVSVLLTLSMIVGISVVASTAPANAALATCAAGSAAQNSIRVSPSHTSVFYIDSGVTPRIDASYVGYQVANTSGTPMKGHWVSLTNFVGGQVSLANPADQYMQLPDIAGNDTETVYFLLKASASTKVAQSHDVKVWNKRPDGAGAGNPYGCKFSFKKVAETIKASANKPIATTVSTPGAIGTTFKVTVEGATGTIGQGNPDVGRILYFTPAAYSSFPTRAFRLEKVVLAVADVRGNATLGNNTDYRFYSDQLLVTPSSKPDTSKPVTFGKDAVISIDNLEGSRKYQNEYTFRVLSSAPATTIAPLAQISSGTQIKHTAIDVDKTGTINASTASVNASITKQINSTDYSAYPTATIGGSPYNEVPYKVTLSSTVPAVTDEIVDTPPSGAIYKTGSTQLKIGSGSAATIADPETLTSESSLNPRPLHFIGPFTSGSSSAVVLTYTLYIPAVPGTYSNTVYAKIGDQQVVASTGVAIPRLTVTVGGDNKVSGSTESTVALTPAPLTTPATSIATTSATLNGSIDRNGATTSGFFEWSTSPTLATVNATESSTVTGATDPAVRSTSVTGLTTGTTYYFRIVAVAASVRYVGEIFSFTTSELASTPTVTTMVPTNIATRSVTLNASIDPNLQSITQIDFILSKNENMSAPLPTQTVFDLDDGGAVTTTKTTLSGASPTDISWDVSSLDTTSTYYYYVSITYGSGQTVSGLPTKKSFRTGSTSQYISFAAIDDKPFTDGSFPRSPIATSLKSSDNTSTGLTVSYTSESTDVCTVAETGTVVTFISVGFCVITANQAGNATYAAAEPVSQSFQITPSAPTATTQAASSIAIRSATINGDFTTGGGGSTSVSFTYGTDSGLSGATTTTTANSPSTSNGSRSMNLTGLSPSTTYYYRISASNSTGSTNGSIVSFTTSALSAQTITWTTIPGKTYGQSATASASASSGLTTSIVSMTSSICTVPSSSLSGATVTLLNAGDCVLRASQSGNDTYTAAVAVDETFTVSAKPITVTADNKTRNSGASQPTFTFTPSGLVGLDAISSVTFKFESVTASYSESTTAPNFSHPNGPYTNTPSLAVFGTGSASNYVITYVAGTYTLSALENQVLTWTTIGTKTYGQSATASVVSSKGLTPVTVTSLTTSICTVPSSSSSGATITLLGVGECRLRASQTGSGGIGPANDTNETFTVLSAPLTITASSPTGVTAGDSVPTITASYSGFVNSENSSALSTLPTCVTSYTTSSIAGTTQTTSCSGAASSNYTFTYVSGSFVVGAAAGGPYTVTYDLGGGSGTTPTESSKSNGTSFTTAANSGFSRSGFSFAGWSCNGVTYAALASITMGSSNLTCTAQWSANASPNNPSNNSAPAKPVRKVGISSMITTATRPVSAPVKIVPEPNPSATPKPEPTPSATPKPEPTPSATPKPDVTTPAEVKKTTFLGNGISEVKVQGEEITVVARRGFSGNTIVKVTVKDDEEISQITANVTVLPLPPVNPVARPLRDENTRITWTRSPNALSYEVFQAGTRLCKTSATSCIVPFVVPKEPPLEIISLGRDKTISQSVVAKVAEPPAPVKIIPDVALVINFDTNRFNIDATDRALIQEFAKDVLKYGYKEIDISGHTDSRGGVDNNVLSRNRAKASRDYLLTLVPNLVITIGAYADAINVASNSTAAGLAANRRAEFRVVKY